MVSPGERSNPAPLAFSTPASGSHDRTPRDSRTRNSSVGITLSGERGRTETPAMAIPASKSRRTSRMHLDMPPSVSFREFPSMDSSGAGPSRLQRTISGTRRFTPTSTGAISPGTPWSLFGGVMETDATPLQDLDTPQIKQRRSRNDAELMQTSSHSNFRESETDPFLFAYEQSSSSLVKEPNPSSSPEVLSTDFFSDTSVIPDGFGPVSMSESPPRRLYSFTNWFAEIPILYRNIFKCAFAYFCASLFTFHPSLSGLLSDITSYGPGERRPSPAGHMVATVAVYFNPAKTMGGMIEADVYCFLGLLYAALVCLCSMSMFWYIDVIPGWEWLAEALVISWIGVSMSAVAWTKVWMDKPSFNPACSMISIILFVVVVKEGGAETLLQVTLTVLFGFLVSNLVCYCIWPQSATLNLQENAIRTLDSFSTLLHMLTSTFLLETHLHRTSYETLQKAVENHQASFTTLKKNLAEAQSEWIFTRWKFRKQSAAAYRDAVDSLNRLGQHLNGLRSGTRLQYELALAQSEGLLASKIRKSTSKPQEANLEADVDFKGKAVGEDGMESQDVDEDHLLKNVASMFGELVEDLGPPLKALSVACIQSLNRLRNCLARGQTDDAPGIRLEEFQLLADGIQRALFTFESTSDHAVMRLYRKSEGSSHSSMHSDIQDSMIAGSDNEHVFLVYLCVQNLLPTAAVFPCTQPTLLSFIFTLQEFGRELILLVDAMERIRDVEQQLEARGGWWKNIIGGIASLPAIFSCAARSNDKGARPGLRRAISSIINPRAGRNMHSHVFPRIQPHAPNTIQTPSWSDLTYIGRIKQTIWIIGAAFKERNLKFAIKAGMATAVLAAPAFFDATRPIFMDYRGEWALISFFVVISPTIGATNFMSVHRLLGTLLGASVAAGIYILFPDNAWVLSAFGFLFSLPCFHFIVARPEYATTGRIVLLAYNLTCLFCYNLRDVDVSPFLIAVRRFVAVAVGVVWAALVSRFWWPSEARRELSKALSEFCLNMGWLYTRLVTSNSSHDAKDLDYDRNSAGGSELSPSASEQLNNSVQQFMAMELHLQIKLIELEGLLSQAQHEPRLKGPFPTALYRSILTSLQRILDRLHSMRCVTTREEWWTSVRQDFIIPVNKERREMVGNIILSFSVLGAAFRLKAPLPPYLPPAEQSRQRLVNAIRQLEVVKNRGVKGSKQLLFFAYALTMKGVTRELDHLGRILQGAFGVIGQTSEEFDALFEERRRDIEQDAKPGIYVTDDN